ncbi:hypothetical protein SAMD00024442_17_42 [Candidatus Symbiothrix dinenymphae]|nr:hypothetical protein SAMD00024442_17_42 [Candidatus Symbiothrix dinenymphae]
MDKTTVTEVLNYLKSTLVANGINDTNIALFGSALTGTMHKDSDIDIIIISKSFEDKNIFERVDMTVKPEIEVRRKYNNIPMDILTMSPQEYKRSKEVFFESEIIL